MNLNEIYAAASGDYADTLRRLGNETRVRRFIEKFPADDSFANLSRALTSRDYAAAFRAAHTLKGICANLGLTKLAAAASVLTEALRPCRDDEAIEPAAEELTREYRKVVALIAALDS